MNRLLSVGILLIIVYVVYTYINKKASKCYHCEVRKDKLLRTFMLKSACRKKYEQDTKNTYIGESLLAIQTPSFEEYAKNGGCHNPYLNLPIQS